MTEKCKGAELCGRETETREGVLHSWPFEVGMVECEVIKNNVQHGKW